MFNSTEDAFRQGLRANNFDRQRWFSLRVMFKDQAKRALYKRKFDLASMFATQAQFCREALEVKDILAQIKSIRPSGTARGA